MTKHKIQYIDDQELFIPTIDFRTHVINSDDTYLHSHDFVEIFYIIAGSITHCCDGVEEILSAGDMLFIKPGAEHTFVRTSSEFCSHRDLMFPPSLIENACKYLGSSIYDRFNKNVSSFIKTTLTFAQLNFIEERVKIFLSSPIEGTEVKSVYINSLIVLILNMFLEKLEIPNSGYPAWIDEMLSRFYKTDFIMRGLPELKKKIHFSYPYVCRAFKKYTGKTVLEHLNEARLNYSIILLRHTDMSILDIALNIGFGSIGYFNRIFKKRYNVTPFAYRKQNNSAAEKGGAL